MAARPTTPVTGHFFLDADPAQAMDHFTIDRAVWESMTPEQRRAYLNEALVQWADRHIDLDWVVDDRAESGRVADQPDLAVTVTDDENGGI